MFVYKLYKVARVRAYGGGAFVVGGQGLLRLWSCTQVLPAYTVKPNWRQNPKTSTDKQKKKSEITAETRNKLNSTEPGTR